MPPACARETLDVHGRARKSKTPEEQQPHSLPMLAEKQSGGRKVFSRTDKDGGHSGVSVLLDELATPKFGKQSMIPRQILGGGGGEGLFNYEGQELSGRTGVGSVVMVRVTTPIPGQLSVYDYMVDKFKLHSRNVAIVS